MVTCVDMRKIELLLVGVNTSLAILPRVPIESPLNVKLEHQDVLPRYDAAWRRNLFNFSRVETAPLSSTCVTSLFPLTVECANW